MSTCANWRPRKSLYALFVFGSNALAPFFAGFITNAMGWQAAIWFGTIVLAVTTVIIFFTLEETIYFRSTIEGVDEGDAVLVGESAPAAEKAAAALEAKGGATSSGADAKTTISGPPSSSSPAPEVYYAPRRTYIQRLALFRNMPGRPSVKQMFVMMYRPLLIFFYFPCVDWAGFLYGINLSWYNVNNATMALVLGSAPYGFSSSMVGVAFLSPFVGAVVGALWAGTVGDKVALYLARRNGGVREPEHRLWVLLVSGLLGAAGFILWGVGADHDIHYMGLIIGVGLVEMMVVAGGSTAMAYDIDCFKELAGETMILVIVIRNTLGFGMSYGITPWLTSQGYTKTFVAVGMLALVCNYSFLAFAAFGKRMRKFSATKYWQFLDNSIVSSAH